MQQTKENNYADSIRAWASGYKDSVAVDYDATQMRYIYVHKDHKDSWKGGVEDNSSSASADWQYWMVPTFFAIMFALIIFAFILYRDNDRALKQKRTDKIMNFIKNK
jgi:hypothetical protein